MFCAAAAECQQNVTVFRTTNSWPSYAPHIVEEVGGPVAVVILDRLNHARRFQLFSVTLARLTLGRAIPLALGGDTIQVDFIGEPDRIRTCDPLIKS